MASLDDNKCLICKQEIDNKEKCCAIHGGTLSVDYFKGGHEAVFYENENEPPEALICKGCTAEHIRFLLHGRALLEASKEALERLQIGNYAGEENPYINTLEIAIAKIEGSKKP